MQSCHGNVFPNYWLFLRGILAIFLSITWTNCWKKNQSSFQWFEMWQHSDDIIVVLCHDNGSRMKNIITSIQGYFLGFRHLIHEKLAIQYCSSLLLHDDIIKWKHFPRNWPFVRGIHRSRWIPHTKASDAELWCFLWSASLWLSKQPWGWWFETPLWSSWRQCNVKMTSCWICNKPLTNPALLYLLTYMIHGSGWNQFLVILMFCFCN